MNANLLQRSEVVALINTLHRFSESLDMVDRFRQMWSETDDADSDRLIREAERAASSGAPWVTIRLYSYLFPKLCLTPI